MLMDILKERILSLAVQFILYMLRAVPASAKGGCLTGGFSFVHGNNMVDNHALHGHVIANVTATEPIFCFRACQLDCRCISFNYQQTVSKDNCQLNEENRYTSPIALEFVEGWKYYDLVINFNQKTNAPSVECQNGCCENNPCLNGGTCRETCDVIGKRFICECGPLKSGKFCENVLVGRSCQDIKNKGQSVGDGMYWLDPDGGSHSNAFLAYCDMTSYGGGWTMCYTTDEYAKPKTEVTYKASLPYGTDGYRTNCNNISFREIIFIDHQTGNTAYFKRKSSQPVTATTNYGKRADTYGLWDGFGAMNSGYSYQLLICDTSFYSGFFVSGYTGNCYKQCNSWCGDGSSPYFRTASTDSRYKGVAFNANGHRPVSTRLMSVGLR